MRRHEVGDEGAPGGHGHAAEEAPQYRYESDEPQGDVPARDRRDGRQHQEGEPANASARQEDDELVLFCPLRESRSRPH